MTATAATGRLVVPARTQPFASMMFGGAVPALATTAVLAVVMGVARGPNGLGGALAGGVLATAFFAGGAVALNAMLRAWIAPLALTSALVVYMVQMLLAVAAALALATLPLDRLSIALALLGATGAWLAGQIWGFSRARVLVSDAPLPSDRAGEGS